jgi:tRNA (guanine10-N2)-dimethyltransferase
MQDDSAVVRVAEPRVLTASAMADPDLISRRVAFSRRVGALVPDGAFGAEQLRLLRSGTYRVSVFDLRGKTDYGSVVSEVAEKVGGSVSLENPDIEVTVVRGYKDYFALTRPSSMSQGWATRRPRKRAFFHPAAIFPKLSRALVNLSRVRSGEVLLDPFCGTGSLLLEAYEIGAVPVGSDIDARMVRGARRNMAGFHQDWLGLVRADAGATPLRKADAISTDVPYGRASSTSGSDTRHIIDALLASSSSMLRRGHRLVLMHPRSVQVEGAGGFELEEEHQLYIHRKLTRTISVLRRV